MDLADCTWLSPTHGRLAQLAVVTYLSRFVSDTQPGEYRLMVGSDSRPPVNAQTQIVTAIALIKRGDGGIFFVHRAPPRTFTSLHQRITAEVEASIRVAAWLRENSVIQPLSLTLEVHLDIGEIGPTRELIRSLANQVNGHGYEAAWKPNSPAASCVAHRYT